MPPEQLTEIFWRLAVAVLGGLAVGMERELSARADGAPPRFAGVRTFLLFGLIGGVGAVLADVGARPAAIALLGATALLIVCAYCCKAIGGERDATTEVAAIAVLAAGVLAGTSMPLASGIFALTWLVLAEKSRIHGFVDRIEPEILVAAARFSVLALVVLPIIPAASYGPEPGFRPRELWIFVLLFSGVSFVGFLALKAFGAQRGYGLAGLLGGLVSSTAVTLSFSRESRIEPAAGRPLAVGLLAACTVVFARVAALVLVFNYQLGLRTLTYLAPPFVAGGLLLLVLLGSRGATRDTPFARNPLRIGAAIQMALLFQAFLYLVEWARAAFGSTGILASAAVLGSTDMDALTFSMVKYASEGEQSAVAARALAIGLLSNTVVKLLMALSIGRGEYRRHAVLGLGLLAVAGAVAIVWL